MGEGVGVEVGVEVGVGVGVTAAGVLGEGPVTVTVAAGPLEHATSETTRGTIIRCRTLMRFISRRRVLYQ